MATMEGTRARAAEGGTPGPAVSRHRFKLSWAIALFSLFSIVGLPVAGMLDLTNVSNRLLTARAMEIDRIMRELRSVYSSEVVGPWARKGVVDADGQAFPPMLPFTLSIALTERIEASDIDTSVGIVSDAPFDTRAAYPLDAFEVEALAAFRAGRTEPVVDRSRALMSSSLRLATPIVMEGSCVSCHNTHPDSPRRDWRVGDIRGIQEIEVERPLTASLATFRHLGAFGVVALIGAAGIILAQRRQEVTIRKINAALSDLSAKIARFVPRQVYEMLFSGTRDAVVRAERKRLTIFMSDIADFTEISAQVQPEVLSRLLNEYFSEMSRIADRHGGTVDKFIGDAMLVFFGDPVSDGADVDAARCLAMAREMQGALVRLQGSWRAEGIERPLRARMGINTGYCDVGNFGSKDRMDYTIIGPEVNLTARLQAIAPVGGICVTYETLALLRGRATGRALDPIEAKGIARPIVPYVLHSRTETLPGVVDTHGRGIDLFLDVDALEGDERERAARALRRALALLDGMPGRRGVADGDR